MIKNNPNYNITDAAGGGSLPPAAEMTTQASALLPEQNYPSTADSPMSESYLEASQIEGNLGDNITSTATDGYVVSDAGANKAADDSAAHDPKAKVTYTDIGQYIASGDFITQASLSAASSTVKTGFPNLDSIQMLHPGLIFLGGNSGLGKTTFALQLADQVAASGTPVLFFALEQGPIDLASKSLSRGFFLEHRRQEQANGSSIYPTPTSMGLRLGVISKNNPNELDQQCNAYSQAVGDRLVVINGRDFISINDIQNIVANFISTHHTKPVVIIDYLQIVLPPTSDKHPDARSAVNAVLRKLKLIQVQYGIVVFVISSINRENYSQPIDFVSFKESGAIEYTADMVWGLQLSALTSPGYRKVKDPAVKRNILFSARAEIPRKVTLVCLKNRFGISNYTASFDYYPANDCFIPCTSVPDDDD